ncbi:hypothetical protein ACRAWG_31050 [Methylobacterium sp. P31]
MRDWYASVLLMSAERINLAPRQFPAKKARGRQMPDALIVPLTMAIVFTIGGVVIQRLERHAERVTNVLGVVLMLLSFLDIFAVFSRLADESQRPMPRTAIHQPHVQHVSSQPPVISLVGVN